MVKTTRTGHIIGATYRSKDWGYLYKCVGTAYQGEGARVRVTDLGNHELRRSRRRPCILLYLQVGMEWNTTRSVGFDEIVRRT